MKEMEEQGMPVNRFARLVEEKDEVEVMPSRFPQYIAELPTSEKEKAILRSIVEKKRNGRVEVFVKGELKGYFEIETKESSDDDNKIKMMVVLDEALGKVGRGSDVGFLFEEK
jgi:hypothetical protein